MSNITVERGPGRVIPGEIKTIVAGRPGSAGKLHAEAAYGNQAAFFMKDAHSGAPTTFGTILTPADLRELADLIEENFGA
jgi:hypothetical protein